MTLPRVSVVLGLWPDRPAEENPADVKATGKLAKLYDALVKANPDWATDARRHDMNQFMTRMIFCMFAEDVGIFPENSSPARSSPMPATRARKARRPDLRLPGDEPAQEQAE